MRARWPVARQLVAALAAGLVLVGVPAAATAEPVRPLLVAEEDGPPEVSRIAATDRYSAGVALSQQAFTDGRRPEVVYLTSGADREFALAAAPASVRGYGTTLSTAPHALSAQVHAELERLQPRRIVLVGDADILSAAVERAAATIAPTTRLDAATAPAAALQLARAEFEHSGVGRVWVSGAPEDEADADAVGLIASVAAGANRAPLLIVERASPTLDPALRALLVDLGVHEVSIVGSTREVSQGIEDDIGSIDGVEVRRIAGATPAQTAQQVLEQGFVALAPGTVFLSPAEETEVALGALAEAGRIGRPLLLTEDGRCASSELQQTLTTAAVESVTILGDPAAVRAVVASGEPCLSIDDPESDWVVVNKTRSLDPAQYVPSGLTPAMMPGGKGIMVLPRVSDALERLFEASAAEGAGRLGLASGYRDYASQSVIWSNRRSERGRAYADEWIARPGYSEHQLGLAVDIEPIGASGCTSHLCIANTPQGEWLAEHAWRFGFVIRYQPGQEHITGYRPEAWHLRYVGEALAADLHEGGWRTLEEYFDLPAAPDYLE
ncbi:MAG: D-alanyl-D-alanine carboxypeptidase family protein [Actinomycetia bacterium]|nr:D-alanyl-D-alanine carboxypeptidase family protein [Actinomycetes bacterium]